MISYDDFAKLEIRIGEIREIEIVENADKLLKLTVDLGDLDEAGTPRMRQIVSGIREFFADPGVLVGTRCPFLVNLEPRTIRGLVSEGMILAGKKDDAFALLLPSSVLPIGTKIS